MINFLLSFNNCIMKEFREGGDEDVGSTGMFEVAYGPVQPPAVPGVLTSVKDPLSDVELANLGRLTRLEGGGGKQRNGTVMFEDKEFLVTAIDERPHFISVCANFCHEIISFMVRDGCITMVMVGTVELAHRFLNEVEFIMSEAVGKGKGGLMSDAAMNNLVLLASRRKCRVIVPCGGLDDLSWLVDVELRDGWRVFVVSVTCEDGEFTDNRLAFTVLNRRIVNCIEGDPGQAEIFLETITSIED